VFDPQKPSGDGEFEIKASLKGHEKQVSAVAFSPHDPTLMATGGYDNTVPFPDPHN
jgi:WD40 repeat protein